MGLIWQFGLTYWIRSLTFHIYTYTYIYIYMVEHADRETDRQINIIIHMVLELYIYDVCVLFSMIEFDWVCLFTYEFTRIIIIYIYYIYIRTYIYIYMRIRLYMYRIMDMWNIVLGIHGNVHVHLGLTPAKKLTISRVKWLQTTVWKVTLNCSA